MNAIHTYVHSYVSIICNVCVSVHSIVMSYILYALVCVYVHTYTYVHSSRSSQMLITHTHTYLSKFYSTMFPLHDIPSTKEYIRYHTNFYFIFHLDSL